MGVVGCATDSDDAEGDGTGSTAESPEASTTTSSSPTGGTTTSGPDDGSSSSGDPSSSQTSDATGETTSGTDEGSSTGGPAVCADEPQAPANGGYDELCAGSEEADARALSCDVGFVASAEAVCGDDGQWSEPMCLDTRDVDGDGQRRYPWGADLDDDGDGELTLFVRRR